MRPVATRPFPLPFPPDDPCPIPAYFDSFAPPAPQTEKLDGDGRADVVVVGGGYTGLSTAVHLTERGIRPLVLEARDIGCDLNPHLHELAPGLWAALGYSGRGIALATMMGRDLAARIAAASDTPLAFSAVPLQSSRIARIARPLVSCLLTWYRVRDALDDLRHARAAPSLPRLS